jgi:serine/threonine-protein kinase
VLAIVALGGAGAYGLVHARSASPGDPATLAPAAVVQVVATADTKPRTVKVVILPDDAKVEVDGAGVTPNDGAVEITGAIGSVHKVKVTTGDGEVLRDVAITEGGAIPPKVEGAAPKLGGAKPAAKPPQAPPAQGPAASPLRMQR